MLPNLDRAAPPEFWQMGIDAFEELTCALLDKEPGVDRADLYHTRFDAQYGIDAFGETADGLIVASSKRYQTIRKGWMARWSDDFLKHWEAIWRAQGVVKFVLVTAAHTHSRERLADIAAEKARFTRFGVTYEVWSPRQLQERLRPFPGLVSQYLAPEFVARICGDLEAGAFGAVARTEDLSALQDALAGFIESRVEVAARSIELGRPSEAAGELDAVRAMPQWQHLPGALRARILRLQGSVALSRGDVDVADQLSAEGDKLSATDEPRLRANIAFHRDGAAAALAALETPTTDAGRGLKAAFLIALEDFEGARAELAAMTADTPEGRRVQGHIALAEGNLEAAGKEAETGLALAPQSLPLQRLAAMAKYASALSPVTPRELFRYPAPVSAAFVRRDDAAQQNLAAALAIFESLRPLAGRLAQEFDDTWRLACLCNMTGREADATAVARVILASRPDAAVVIAWALARDLQVDLKPSRLALRAALFKGDVEPNGVRALGWLTENSDRPSLAGDVEALLERGGWPELVAEELAALLARLRDRSDEREEAEERRVGDILNSGDVDRIAVEFARHVEAGVPHPALLALGTGLAVNDAWPALATGEQLLLAFETSEAVRLAAFAAHNTGNVSRALQILQDHLGLFPGGRLPYDLRRLEVRALAAAGQPGVGLERAVGLADETKAAKDRLLEAKLRLEIGDLQGVAQLLEALLADGQLGAQDSLAWAQRLAGEELETARALWRHATAQPLPDPLAMGAYHLAFGLGLENERPELSEVAARLAQVPDSGVEVVELDRVVEIMRRDHERAAELDAMWVDGKSPVHAIAAAARISLAELFDVSAAPEARLRPIFIRSGALGAPQTGPALATTGRLFIDVTGLLMADQLNLLETVARLTTPHLAASTIATLLAMENRVRHPQPRRAAAARAVLDQVGHGVGAVAPSTAMRVTHEAKDGAIALSDLMAALGSDRDAPAWTALGVAPRAALVFCEQTLDLVADADRLDELIGDFDVYADAEALELSREEVARAVRGQALATRVAKLRARLADGIAKGHFTIAPSLPSEDGDEESGDERPLALALREIIRAADVPNDRVWIDDRMISGFTQFGVARVVGLLDILSVLRREHGLEDEDWYAKLLELRAGGCLFIPITADEVLRWLARAPVRDGMVVETSELTTLRRYAGLVLRFQDRLRVQPADGALASQPLELPAALGLRQVMRECVVERWNAQVSVEIARAQSDWLWRALRSEHPPQPPTGPIVTPLLFAALNFAELIAGGLQIGSVGEMNAYQRRAAYFAWVDEVAIRGRFRMDPQLGRETATIARSLLRVDEGFELKLKAKERRQLRTLTRVVFSQLPPDVQEVIGDESLLKDLGVDSSGILGIQSLQFLGSEFWRAAQKALASGRARLTTIDGTKVAMTRRVDLADGVGLQLDGLPPLADCTIGLLAADAATRAAALERTLFQLDVPLDEHDAVRAEISGAQAPHHIMRLVDDLRRRSIGAYFGGLARDVQAGDTSVSRLDPPPARDWLRFVRWVPGGDAIAATALRLVADLGPREATRRLASLPVSLPDALSRQFLDEEGPNTITVMARIHRLRALRVAGNPSPEALAGEADLVVQASVDHGALHAAALRFAARSFEYQEDWESLTPEEKHVVVWCYADHLTDMVLRLNFQPAPIAEMLQEHAENTAAYRSLELERGYDDTPWRAGVMSHRGILLAGLEYGLGFEVAERLALSDAQGDRLREAACAQTDQGAWVSSPDRGRLAEGRMPTWLTRPDPDAIVPNGAHIEAELVDVVTGLADDPYAAQPWNFLLAFGRPALPGGSMDDLGTVLAGMDLSRIIALPDGGNLLRMVADIAGRLAPQPASDAVLNGLVALSRTWLGPPESEDFEGRLHTLVEAAAAAARAYDGTGRQRLSNFLGALFAARPDAAGPLRPILDMLVDVTPVMHATPFWRALVAARSY
ncbi:hypothetical protein [Phenylobacterium sp.]|uniref:hypothetical protein n=1 Tax=Phenylobacterium sp. TaxID=1871053 RepID=UPI003BAA5CDC